MQGLLRLNSIAMGRNYVSCGYCGRIFGVDNVCRCNQEEYSRYWKLPEEFQSSRLDFSHTCVFFGKALPSYMLLDSLLDSCGIIIYLTCESLSSIVYDHCADAKSGNSRLNPCINRRPHTRTLNHIFNRTKFASLEAELNSNFADFAWSEIWNKWWESFD